MLTTGLKKARDLIAATETCVLASYGPAGLTCGTFFYANPAAWKIVVISDLRSRHVTNIHENPTCIRVLITQGCPSYGLPALQLCGECDGIVQNSPIVSSLLARSVFARFPSVVSFFTDYQRAHATKLVVLELTIRSVEVTDEETFGVGGVFTANCLGIV